jgi:hypothetical protein
MKKLKNEKMTIKIWEVVNYEAVSKMLNLLSSQNPYSFHPFFTPIQPQIHPKSPRFHPLFTPFHLKSVSILP